MIWIILTYVILVWYGLHLARGSDRAEGIAEVLAAHAGAMIGEGSYHCVRTQREAWAGASSHRRTASALRFMAKAVAVIGVAHVLLVLTGGV